MRILFLSCTLILLTGSAHAQNYKLYSVFLYSFTRYIQWPEEANTGDFEIAVLGESPMLAELKTMAEQKKVGSRSIRVTKINAIGELKNCNILFVPASKSAQITEILAKVGKSPTLVVTEQPGLCLKGSGINFVEKAGKLAFELNNASLNSRKLRASIELTRMAIMI